MTVDASSWDSVILGRTGTVNRLVDNFGTAFTLECWPVGKRSWLIECLQRMLSINIRSWGPFLPDALQQDASSRSSVRSQIFKHGFLKSVICLIPHVIQGQKGPSIKCFIEAFFLLSENPSLEVGQMMKTTFFSACSVGVMVVNKILNYAQKQKRRCKRADYRAKIFFSKKLLQIAKQALFLPKIDKKYCFARSVDTWSGGSEQNIKLCPKAECKVR